MHRVFEGLGRVQFVQGQNSGRNVAKYRPGAAILIERVDTKAGQLGDFERKVGFVEFFERLALLVVHDVVHHAVHFFVHQRRHVDAFHVAVDADHRRNARRQMQVRRIVLHRKGEKLRDIDRHLRLLIRLRRWPSAVYKRVLSPNMLIGPQNLTLHVTHVRSRIRSAAMAAGRDPESVTLVAVTKGKPAESVRLAATAGVTDFGENYLQEAQAKMDQLADLPLEVAFHRRHSIQQDPNHRRALRLGARRGSPQRGAAAVGAKALSRPAAQCLHPGGARAGAHQGRRRRRMSCRNSRSAIAALPRLRLRGLMCVPPPQPNAAAERAVFARLRTAQSRI